LPLQPSRRSSRRGKTGSRPRRHRRARGGQPYVHGLRRQAEADAEESPQEAKSPEASSPLHQLWQMQRRPDPLPCLHGRPGEEEHDVNSLQSRDEGRAEEEHGSWPPENQPPPLSPRHHGRSEEEQKVGKTMQAFPRRRAPTSKGKSSCCIPIWLPPEPALSSPRSHGRPRKKTKLGLS
jgi:hypothetical protein